jgi:hypothetical protein
VGDLPRRGYSTRRDRAGVHEDDNNFCGIEQATRQNGDRLIAASDRDHGLFLFDYTGD